MPTYEYECKNCGHKFEVFQSMRDAPLKVCPECNGEIHRLINGGGGVIFKGPGFYVTDRKAVPAKKPGKPGEAPASAQAEPAPCAATCANADSCPAAGGAANPEKKAGTS